jgi:hypothetical protein
MFPTVAKIIVVCVVVFFLVLCFWRKPITRNGDTALKLSIVNAIGWLIVIMLPHRGFDDPLAPVGVFVFWLVNCVLLPALAVVLWVCRRDGEERNAFLAIAAGWLTINVIVLFIVPLVGLISALLRS